MMNQNEIEQQILDERIDCPQAQQILRMGCTGVWRLDVKHGKTIGLYANAIMDDLIGVETPMTGMERHAFHRAHIHPQDMELFDAYSKRLLHTRAEIVYRYLHPTQGEMVVRCSGMILSKTEDGMSIGGTHQDISETFRLEQERELERRLAEKNDSLRHEQAQQEDYYRELLDMQSCAVMAYSIPDYKLRHMNAEALRIYGMESIEHAQREIRSAVSNAYYPRQDTVEKLR